MPVRHVRPRREEYPELVADLVRVLKQDQAEGPPGEPEITIEEIKFSDNLRVVVVWDKWEGIDLQERGRIILTAIGEALGEKEMLRVTLAMGLTREEEARVPADFRSAFAAYQADRDRRDA